MSPRRAPRAMVVAVLASTLIAQLLALPALAVEPAQPDAAGDARRAALEAVRDQHSGVLRGVLSAIGANAGFGRSRAADLAGLVTKQTAAGTTLVAVTIRTGSPIVRDLLDRLERLGVQIANRDETSVEAYLAPAVLELVAALPGIDAIEPIMPTVLQGVVGAGVSLHGADTWQSAGYLGAGIKVGIIDGGFAGMAARLGVELPDSVHARCYSGVGTFSSSLSVCEAEGVDHGTGVAETIVDMAPGVSLYIANPFSLQDYQRTVTWMASNGVKVINASLATSFQGPGDGSDPTGASLYTVVSQASNAGILWVNSAGNSGENGWLGPWSDADGDDFLDFAAGDATNSVALSAGQQVIVTARWNDPWGRSANDYDLGVFDASSALIASSVDTQNGNDDPVETLIFEAPATGVYDIVATLHAGVPVSRFQLLLLTSGDSPLEHQVTAGTIPSPVDSKAPGLLTVGAVDVSQPGTIETYSSRGPTVDNRVKPDLVAGDCGTTTALGTFCGTSQSAPHVAGAAALVLDAFPSYTAPQIAAFLRSHAEPLGSPTPNSTFGWGRLAIGTAPGAAPPAGLAFQVQPGGGIEGAPLAGQPVVRIVDEAGATVSRGTGATLEITLALDAATNTAGAVLTCSGGLAARAVAGIATFSGCTVDRAAPGLRLVAIAGSLPHATSTPFTVTGVPVVLRFAAQPSDGAAGQPLPTQPVVEITNGSGGVHATGASSALPVTLSLGANGAAATLTCASGTTVPAVAGVATFSGCAINAPGTNYTLVATAGVTNTAASAPFTLGDPSGLIALPTLALTSSESAIRWGSGVVLTVRLTASGSAAPVAGRAVLLQSTIDGTTWSTVGGALTTDAAGEASLTYRPVTNRYYRAVFEAAADLAAGTSPSARVVVRQLSALRPTNGNRVKVVPRRTQVAFKTTVRPSRVDVPAGDVTLQLFRLVGSRWTLADTQTATPDAQGVATIFVTFDTAGKWYVRTQADPTPVNANSGWNPIERYDVR